MRGRRELELDNVPIVAVCIKAECDVAIGIDEGGQGRELGSGESVDVVLGDVSTLSNLIEAGFEQLDFV